MVTKYPRFAFEKFPQDDATLTTQMKSVGEAMSIGRTFKESLQKALRSLEIDRYGLESRRDRDGDADKGLADLRQKISVPNWDQHAAAQVLPCLDCHGAFATHALGVAGLAILTAQVALSEYVPDAAWEWVGPDQQTASDLVTAAALSALGRGLRYTVLLGLLIGLFDLVMYALQMTVPATELGWGPDLGILAGATALITVAGIAPAGAAAESPTV